MGIADSKFIIVGAGFYGAVMAERISRDLGEKVVLIDKRNHLGGNSYSYSDHETQIEVHQYGSHIFHTSNKDVWNYINQFSAFNNYRHRVFSEYQEKIYSLPINLDTLNSFFQKKFTPSSARNFFDQFQKIDQGNFESFESKAKSLLGEELYEAFFRGYTLKQWEIDPTLLPASTFSRLPVRFNYNSFYFDDPFQGIPVDGYGKIFSKMLNHPLIDVHLGVDFFQLKKSINLDNSLIIYSGPIDQYYDYCFGELNWRTLDFQEERYDLDDYQGTSVINYPDLSVPYTRIHEFKHYNSENKQVFQNKKTIIFKEFSRKATTLDIPYYPVNTSRDQEVYSLYRKKSLQEKNVLFGGRLGLYQYLDMHQVIALALQQYQQKIKGRNLETIERINCDHASL